MSASGKLSLLKTPPFTSPSSKNSMWLTSSCLQPLHLENSYAEGLDQRSGRGSPHFSLSENTGWLRGIFCCSLAKHGGKKIDTAPALKIAPTFAYQIVPGWENGLGQGVPGVELRRKSVSIMSSTVSETTRRNDPNTSSPTESRGILTTSLLMPG